MISRAIITVFTLYSPGWVKHKTYDIKSNHRRVRSYAHVQWIVNVSGQFAENLIEISNRLVRRSRSGV